MKRAALVLFCIFSTAAVFAASSTLQKAEDLLMRNKPSEARPLLEQALSEDPMNETAYLYLGLVHQQMGDADKAITILKRGLAISKAYKDLFYFDIGNNFFSQGQLTFAEEMFTNAIAANANMANAYLNRANSRLKLQKTQDALDDYTIFLQLRPQDPQRPQIEAVMGIINQILLAEAEKRKQEEAKQKALMNDVLSSLNNASEDTKNLSVQSLQFKQESEDVGIHN
jgi:tetratricopeptide (TPR) repeat protein